MVDDLNPQGEVKKDKFVLISVLVCLFLALSFIVIDKIVDKRERTAETNLKTCQTEYNKVFSYLGFLTNMSEISFPTASGTPITLGQINNDVLKRAIENQNNKK